MRRRAFTLEAANTLLPHVRATLRRVAAGQEAAQRRVDKMVVLDALWGEALLNPSNPDHDELEGHRAGLSRIQRAIARLIEDRLTSVGIRLPAGGLDHGLVDFPTTLDGRWIYLCWHAGEDEVGYWHETGAGFGGRVPITREIAARFGLLEDPALEDDSALDF